MQFVATIELNGKTATGIPVPAEVLAALGAGKRPPVRVTIKGYTYRSTVGNMGGRPMLPVSAEHRTGAGVSAGEEVEVELVLDTEPREVDVPDDFAAALQRNDAARQAFEALSYSKKQAHVSSIEGAKTPETRQRRIEKAMAALQTTS